MKDVKNWTPSEKFIMIENIKSVDDGTSTTVFVEKKKSFFLEANVLDSSERVVFFRGKEMFLKDDVYILSVNDIMLRSVEDA